MPKRVEGGDRVGDARTQVEPGHVGLDQRRGRRSLSGQLQLCGEGVNGQDAMFRRQQPRRWFARAATKFDDEASGRQSRSSRRTKFRRVGDADDQSRYRTPMRS